MKSIRVKYNGRVSSVQAMALEQLASAIKNTFNVQTVRIICPPIHREEQFSILKDNQQIVIMTEKVKQLALQANPSSQPLIDVAVIRIGLPLLDFNPIFCPNFDSYTKRQYSEYISVVFLMQQMKQLKNWMKRHDKAQSPASMFIRQFNSVNKKMLDRRRKAKIPLMGLYMAWFNHRETNVSKDPDRCSPAQLLEDIHRIIEPEDIVHKLLHFRCRNKSRDIIIRIDIRQQNLHHLQLHLKHRAIFRPSIDEFTNLPLYLVFWINRYNPGARVWKYPGEFNYPKILDLNDMCSRELQIKAQKGRGVQEELLSGLSGSFEQRYSTLQYGWKQWEYQDHYYQMHESNMTNCYNLVGFVTQKNGWEFQTVVEATRNEWHRCTNGLIEGISQDQALGGYVDGAETAELLLYRRIYYP